MPTITVNSNSLPGSSDLVLQRGNTLLLTATVTGKSYTGYTLTAQVRDQISSRELFPITAVLDNVTSGNSTIIISKSASQMYVRPGIYDWALVAMDGDDWAAETIVKGTIRIENNIAWTNAEYLEDEGGNVIVTN